MTKHGKTTNKPQAPVEPLVGMTPELSDQIHRLMMFEDPNQFKTRLYKILGLAFKSTEADVIDAWDRGEMFDDIGRIFSLVDAIAGAYKLQSQKN